MNANEQQAPSAAYAAAAWHGGHRLGNFELQSAMLRGSTAVIYRAWDHSLSRPVAIKEYLPAALAVRDADGTALPSGPDTAEGFETGLYAFIDEARLLARCDHPSLVRVLDLIEAHGTAYRVMPWYSGRSLRDVRRRMAGPIGEPALRLLLDNLLGALEAFQQVGGVHRGVSPSQALLLDVNRALLMGPGAANRVNRAGSKVAAGPAPEAGFAPPEQGPNADGQPQGPWSDFYALAAVARFCITGVPPSAAGLEAPEPLAAAVERMFARQPSARYAPELLEALDAALSRDVTRRPQSAAQFREQVLRSAPPQPHAALPPQAPETYTVQPTAPPAEPALDTQGAERMPRVTDSTPPLLNVDALIDTDPPPSPPSATPLRAEPGDRDLAGAVPRSRTRRHGLLWASLLGVGAVAAGVAAWLLVPSLRPIDTDPAPTVALQTPAPLAPVPAPEPATTSATATATAPAPVPAANEPAATPPPTKAAPGPATSTPLVPTAAPTRKAAPPTVGSTPTPADTPQINTSAAAPVAAQRAVDTAGTGSTSPRQECGARTEFSLYRCMQSQCSLPKWQRHPQCERLRATDSVD